MTLHEFFNALCAELPELGPGTSVCLRAEASSQATVKVLARAVFSVLREMENYLSDYEDTIAKTFGADSEPEALRLIQATITPFAQALRLLDSNSRSADALERGGVASVAQLIDAWNSFERDTVDAILAGE